MSQEGDQKSSFGKREDRQPSCKDGLEFQSCFSIQDLQRFGQNPS